MLLTATIIVVLLVAVAGYVIALYNALVRSRQMTQEAWSGIDVQLKRRADLVPNLVETVKGYAAHERETLEAVVNARAKATSLNITAKDLGDAAAMQRLQTAQGELGSALSRLMVVVERYPDLKGNQNFLDLQNQLEGTENRINVARQRYNEAVGAFNYAIRKFPNSLTNSLLLHLERKEYFQAEEGAKAAPTVKF
jgi:LemA protein